MNRDVKKILLQKLSRREYELKKQLLSHMQYDNGVPTIYTQYQEKLPTGYFFGNGKQLYDYHIHNRFELSDEAKKENPTYLLIQRIQKDIAALQSGNRK